MKFQKFGDIFFQFLKYGLVGIIGTIVHTSILMFLVENFGMRAVHATIFGFIASLMLSYILNLRWTFNNSINSSIVLFKYTLVSLFGLSINVSIMYIMVDLLHVWYLIAQVVVLVVVPFANFMLNRYWAFSKLRKPN